MNAFEKVKSLDKINSIQKERVSELVNSMLKNGWKGSPILYAELGLITGSHRVEALQHLEDVYWDVEENI